MLRLIWWAITGFRFREKAKDCSSHQWGRWGRAWRKYTGNYDYTYTQTRKCVDCNAQEFRSLDKGYGSYV